MQEWLPLIIFVALAGTIAVCVVGWERENRAKARKRLAQSQNRETTD